MTVSISKRREITLLLFISLLYVNLNLFGLIHVIAAERKAVPAILAPASCSGFQLGVPFRLFLHGFHVCQFYGVLLYFFRGAV